MEFLEKHPSNEKGEMESVTRWQKSSAPPFMKHLERPLFLLELVGELKFYLIF